MLLEMYGPESKPKWAAIIALLENAQWTILGPDGKRYPVITRLSGTYGSPPLIKMQTTIIVAGPKGPMYTVRNVDNVVVRNATIEELRANHPELYQQFRYRYAADVEYIAEHSADLDSRLNSRPIPFDASAIPPAPVDRMILDDAK